MSAPTVKCQRRSKGRKVERKYVKIKYFDMQTTKHFMDVSSAWSYPRDDFDRVCKIIWSRAEEVEEKFGRGRHAPEPPQRVDGGHTQSKTSHRYRIHTNDAAERMMRETIHRFIITKERCPN